MDASQTSPEAPARNYPLWICVLLALSTLLVYWPVTHHEFVGYDDTDYVTQNPHVQAGLSGKSLAWVWRSEVARNWHPVTMLSHMLDCQLFGMRPGWHHFTNLLFHSANSLLLFLLLKQMTGAVWRSGLVAALFALHPLHVESVAWVAERKDVLSTLFFLLTIWAYCRYAKAQVGKAEVRNPRAERKPKSEGRAERYEVRGAKAEARADSPFRTPHSALRIPSVQHPGSSIQYPASGIQGPASYYVLCLVFFALGLMSKPMLVTLPFVLLLLDYWPLERLRLAGKNPAPKTLLPIMLEKIPFLLLSAGSCVVTFLVQAHGGAVRTVSTFPIATRVENALVSYVRYLEKMVWPEHLAALYLRRAGWLSWQVALAVVFLLALSALAVWQARRRRYLAVGWFWYLGTLVPVIGLVQVGMQAMADRYTYIPLIGIFIALAWGGAELAEQWRPPKLGLGLAAAAVLVTCMILTRTQLACWQDAETLLLRMVKATEGNYMAHYNLGNLYDRQGKPADAIKHYEAALSFEPNYADAHNNLGGVLLRQGKFDEAISHYSAAVRILTDFLHYFNLANALADAGRLNEATAAYRQALQLDPNSSQAHHNLGLTLQAQGKGPEAITEFRAALQLQADYESAQYNLANLLAEAGKTDEAVACYLSAQRLNPTRAESYNGLGICYAMQGKFAEAERQFREALRLSPRNAGAESNLGNALGAQNRLAEAIPHYQRALLLNSNDFQTHFNLAVSLLRQGQQAEAREHLVEALRLHPDYPEAQKALATLGSEPRPKR